MSATTLTERYAPKLHGVLSCYDRLGRHAVLTAGASGPARRFLLLVRFKLPFKLLFKRQAGQQRGAIGKVMTAAAAHMFDAPCNARAGATGFWWQQPDGVEANVSLRDVVHGAGSSRSVRQACTVRPVHRAVVSVRSRFGVASCGVDQRVAAYDAA